MPSFRNAALTVCVFALLSFHAVASAAALERRPIVGARLRPTPAGLAVDSVARNESGARLGLAPGDILLTIQGSRVSQPADVTEQMRNLHSRERLRLGIIRNGKRVQLAGHAQGRSLERYDGAITSYGAVNFADGTLRDILVKPGNVPEPPVVFMLQGFPCSTIEASEPTSIYARFATDLSRSGIAFYRVEKPGVGDSRSSRRCEDIDFASELGAFRAAYRHLVQDLGFAPDQVFLLGHSLGGIEAPMLAAEVTPRGVAVYGTVLRNWADYVLESALYQPILLMGEDPVESNKAMPLYRRIVQRFFFDHQSPSQIAAEAPELADPMRGLIGWDGKNRTFGRDYHYFQQLAGLDLFKAWRDTKCAVLAMYGETDEIALFDSDHRMIADIANLYRPGSAAYVSFPATMHGMDIVGNREQFRTANRGRDRFATGPFNPLITYELATWVHAQMASSQSHNGQSKEQA